MMAAQKMPNSPPLNSSLQQALIQAVADRCGFKIRKTDQASFRETILKRTQQLELPFPEAYYQLLTSRTAAAEQEWTQLISTITNTESFFFRDKGQFKLLKEQIIPRLLEQNSARRTLRICSAGCSTGEEPYSIAILLKELLPDIESWEVSILGLDINMAAIAKAKAGLYRSWSFRGLDPAVRQIFFTEVNHHYQLNAEIRAMVEFHRINLLQDSFLDLEPAIADLDLILCRNVFIYFDDAAIKTILDKFYQALSPAGYLLVGHAELHNQPLTQFQFQVFEESLAYQRPAGAGHVPPPARQLSPPPSSLSPDQNRQLNTFLTESDAKLRQVSLDLLRQLPAQTKIPRLGNLTAAEIIYQIEQASPSTD